MDTFSVHHAYQNASSIRFADNTAGRVNPWRGGKGTPACPIWMRGRPMKLPWSKMKNFARKDDVFCNTCVCQTLHMPQENPCEWLGKGLEFRRLLGFRIPTLDDPKNRGPKTPLWAASIMRTQAGEKSFQGCPGMNRRPSVCPQDPAPPACCNRTLGLNPKTW